MENKTFEARFYPSCGCLVSEVRVGGKIVRICQEGRSQSIDLDRLSQIEYW